MQVPECPEKDTGQSPAGLAVSLKGIKSGGVCAGRHREEEWRGLTLLLQGLHFELQVLPLPLPTFNMTNTSSVTYSFLYVTPKEQHLP